MDSISTRLVLSQLPEWAFGICLTWLQADFSIGPSSVAASFADSFCLQHACSKQTSMADTYFEPDEIEAAHIEYVQSINTAEEMMDGGLEVEDEASESPQTRSVPLLTAPN